MPWALKLYYWSSVSRDDWTERQDKQMIFICNSMDYCCYDELIIMLAFATLKEGPIRTAKD